MRFLFASLAVSIGMGRLVSALAFGLWGGRLCSQPAQYAGGPWREAPPKNRSLRHIPVALLLRHPWLRTFLEPPPAKACPRPCAGRPENPTLTKRTAQGIAEQGGRAFPEICGAMDGGTQAPMDGLSAFWKALPDACQPPRSRPAPKERNSRISVLHQNRVNHTSQNNPVENIRPHAHFVEPLQEEVDGGDGHQERRYAANQEAIPVYDHIG